MRVCIHAHMLGTESNTIRRKRKRAAERKTKNTESLKSAIIFFMLKVKINKIKIVETGGLNYSA